MSEENEDYFTRENAISKLKVEIERLHLEVNSTFKNDLDAHDVAKQHLQRAEEILALDGELEEALYQTALARNAVKAQRSTRQVSTQWGGFSFGYTLLWLILLLWGYLSTNTIAAVLATTNEGVAAVQTAWFSALGGGVGGVIGSFYLLYTSIFIQKTFTQQKIMIYIIRPLMGIVLGALAYFIIQAGFLVITFVPDDIFELTLRGQLAQFVMIFQLIVGFLAGLNQRWVLIAVDKIVQRLSPTEDEFGNESLSSQTQKIVSDDSTLALPDNVNANQSKETN